MAWIKCKCECGLGDHSRYERSDGGCVVRSHGCNGESLKPYWIGSSGFFDEQINPHKTAEAAMDKLDKLYPIKTEEQSISF